MSSCHVFLLASLQNTFSSGVGAIIFSISLYLKGGYVWLNMSDSCGKVFRYQQSGYLLTQSLRTSYQLPVACLLSCDDSVMESGLTRKGSNLSDVPRTSPCGNHFAVFIFLFCPDREGPSHFHRTRCGSSEKACRNASIFCWLKVSARTVEPKLKKMTPCSDSFRNLSISWMGHNTVRVGWQDGSYPYFNSFCFLQNYP